jgi:hypothetical protein
VHIALHGLAYGLLRALRLAVSHMLPACLGVRINDPASSAGPIVGLQSNQEARVPYCTSLR